MRNTGYLKLCKIALLAAAIAVWGMTFANAEVFVGGYYHLGESDVGAADGLPGSNPTVDSSGLGMDLNAAGPLTYSSNVAASATTATGSNLSMNFGNSIYYKTSELTINTENFGLEGWFKVNDLSQQGLVFNGDSWNDGFGLYILGGRLQGLYGAGPAFDTGFVPTPGEWFYAAIVNNAGATSMYVNNATPIPFGNVDPYYPSSQFVLGAAGHVWDTSDRLNGAADEVRLFAFGSEAYTFDASTDLLVTKTVPEPASLTLLAVGLLGLTVHGWRKRKKT
jgi:hypothetical protein